MLVVAVSALAAVVLLATGKIDSAWAQSTGTGVCDRTAAVRDAIVTATYADTCGDVSEAQLRDLQLLDLSNESITSLSAGDFDDLHSLVVLDLSDNAIAALPAGIFDELYMLEVLRLHDNSLQSLPAALFDQLFVLRELTLSGNPFGSSPETTFDDLSRLKGATTGEQRAGMGQLQEFLDEHDPGSPEDFIAALPDLHKERFVFVYDSNALASEYVSSANPRVISFGADSRFVFAWLTHPDAPEKFRDSVEFMVPDENGWTVGLITFAGETPEIVQPQVCQSCHGTQGKPLWSAFFWNESEHVNLFRGSSKMKDLLASTSPRIAPLDLEGSVFNSDREPVWRFFAPPAEHPLPYRLPAEEFAVEASIRHADVLFQRIKAGDDYNEFAREVVCASDPAVPIRARFMDSREYTLDMFPDSDRFIGPSDDLSLASSVHHYDYYSGTLSDNVVFLILHDLWKNVPDVRAMYRTVSNEQAVTTPGLRYFNRYGVTDYLVYAPGEATAQDELVQLYRILFGYKSRTSMTLEDSLNENYWQEGRVITEMHSGHNSKMAARVCDTIDPGRSGPRDLGAEVLNQQIRLTWNAPTDAGVTGYRIERRSGYGQFAALAANTNSITTTYTDSTASAGESYAYRVTPWWGTALGERSATVVAPPYNVPLQIQSNRYLRMDENSTTATALVATDADDSQLTWTIPAGTAGGTDRGQFRITSSGSISFATAKDFENPDDADTDGTYEVTVQVSDGTHSNNADLRVALVDVNESPSADAGPDQDSVTPGGTVTLAGSATDPDPGDSLTYAWSQTSGETVTLSDASVQAPTFTAPSDLTDDETLVFSLQVTDGGGLHARDTVTVTVEAEQFNGVMAGTMTVGTTTYQGHSVFGYATRGSGMGTFEVTAPADSVYLGRYGKLRIMMRAPGDVTLPSVGEVTDSVTFAYADELTLPFTLLFGETQLSSADAVNPDGDESRVGRFWVWEDITPGWEVDDEVTVSVTTAEEETTEEQTTEEQTTEEQTTEEQVEPPQEEEEDTSDENSAATGTPTIDGTAQVGQTLTADTAGIADEDGLDNATYSYRWLADGTVISGATDSAYTLVAGDQGKAITVQVSFTDDEGNAESLTSQPTAAVAPPPLTASVRSVPGSHDGSASFTFELHFSEEPSLSYVTLRDSAFTESGGEVIKARRLTPGSNLAWEITVQPSSSATVTIVLPPTTDCQDTGAICTADGRKLSNRNVLQTPGPSAQN